MTRRHERHRFGPFGASPQTAWECVWMQQQLIFVHPHPQLTRYHTTSCLSPASLSSGPSAVSRGRAVSRSSGAAERCTRSSGLRWPWSMDCPTTAGAGGAGGACTGGAALGSAPAPAASAAPAAAPGSACGAVCFSCCAGGGAGPLSSLSRSVMIAPACRRSDSWRLASALKSAPSGFPAPSHRRYACILTCSAFP